MKKGLYLLSSALLLIILAVALIGCTETKCDHNFSDEYTTDGTYHWYACTNGCGDVSGRELHYYGSAETTTEPTCTTPGVGVKVCIKCEHKEQVAIPTVAHTYKTTYDYDDANHWRQCQNCDNKIAVTEHKFTVRGHDPENHWFTCSCGAKGNVEAHNWNDVSNSDGTLTRTCADATCNTKITVSDPNHEHLWVDGTITKHPTCTEVGVQEQLCACGATSTKSLDTTSHSFSNGDYQKDDNYHWRNCVCGEQPTEADKVPHSFSDDYVMENGFKVYTCVCGQKKQEVVSGYIDPDGWT